MKEAEILQIQRRYEQMTAEQFAAIKREDLREEGRAAYDREIERRHRPEWLRAEAQKEEEFERSRAAEMERQLPKMWVGYVLAILGLLTGVIEGLLKPGFFETKTPLGYYLLFLVGGWFYWLYCVYRFHEVLERIPGYNHPITAGRAVGMHFIPIYHFYWVFKWPSEIATFVNWRTQARAMNGKVVGLLVLLSALIGRLVDGSLGLVLLFSSGVYISRQLRKAFVAPPVPPPAIALPKRSVRRSEHLNLPLCDQCGQPWDPQDYRRDAARIFCSSCKAELVRPTLPPSREEGRPA